MFDSVNTVGKNSPQNVIRTQTSNESLIDPNLSVPYQKKNTGHSYSSNNLGTEEHSEQNESMVSGIVGGSEAGLITGAIAVKRQSNFISIVTSRPTSNVVNQNTSKSTIKPIDEEISHTKPNSIAGPESNNTSRLNNQHYSHRLSKVFEKS